jgi:uncharacterized membrane protein YkvI
MPTVPWLKMLEPFHPALIIAFGIVVGWTLVETATGVIHAFISRVEIEYLERTKKPLKKISKAIISATALVAALILAQVGIIDSSSERLFDDGLCNDCGVWIAIAICRRGKLMFKK